MTKLLFLFIIILFFFYSMELVKQKHPLWPDSLVEDIARVEFETAAREFMEETSPKVLVGILWISKLLQ